MKGPPLTLSSPHPHVPSWSAHWDHQERQAAETQHPESVCLWTGSLLSPTPWGLPDSPDHTGPHSHARPQDTLLLRRPAQPLALALTSMLQFCRTARKQ